MGILADSLGLENGGVVSLVGAGGKTTLMFRLANEMALRGERVLTTTTTRILKPTPEQSRHVLIEKDPSDLIARIHAFEEDVPHVTAARDISSLHDRNKLMGFDAEAIGRLVQARLFRWVLVEADGASQMPLKAPADHEPVIPDGTDWVIAVAGLDAVGKPNAAPWVFRNNLYRRVTGLSEGAPVAEASVAAVVLSPDGLLKGSSSTARKIVFLNKADDGRRILCGRRIAKLIMEKGRGKIHGIVIGSLEPKSMVIERFGFS